MRKPSCFLQGFGVILTILLIVVTPVSLWIYNFGQIAFDPDQRVEVGMTVLTRTNLLPVGLTYLAGQEVDATTSTEDGETLTSDLFRYLDNDDWQTIQAEVLPPAIYQPWVEEASVAIADWFDSFDPYPQINLQTGDFKQRWGSGHGATVAEVVFNSLPVCTEDQIQAYLDALEPSAGWPEVCQLPAPWQESQLGAYEQVLNFIVSGTPDEIIIPVEVEIREDLSEVEAQRLKGRLTTLRFASQNVIFLPGLLLLIVTVVVVRSLQSWAGWWGIPAFISGILTLPIPLIQRLVVPWWAGETLTGAPSILQREWTDALIRANNLTFNPLYWQAGLLILAGFILLLVAISARPKKPVPTNRLATRPVDQ